MTKEISLTQGQVAIVDDEDFEWLSQWKWHVRKARGKYYAKRSGWVNSTYKNVHMHKVILGIEDQFVDHKDGNPLNNTRSNLRIASSQQNSRNREKQSNNTSGCKGVSWCKRRKKWQARIWIDRKEFHLGYFSVLKEASDAYDAAAILHFGEFARPNNYQEKENE